jgi:hypothetical protein
MRTWYLLVGLVVVAMSGPAEAKPKADRAPADLMVSVALGPAATLRGMQAYIESIEPGAGAQLTDQVMRSGLAQAIGASSLDGVDPAAWLHVLVADGKNLALLAKVADAKVLTTSARANHVMVAGEWAVIGPRPLVQKIGPYALTTIATQPPPTAPTATIYVSHVLARYKAPLDQFRRQLASGMAQAGAGGVGPLFEAYYDGLMSAVRDTERLIVTFDATAALASIDLALVPRPGSRLARFVAAQQPSDYALLDKLPAGNATFLLGGRFETGPYRDGMLDLMAAMYGTSSGADLRAALGAVFKATTGEVAMAMSMPMSPGAGLAMTQLFGLADPAAADKAIVRALDLFKAGRTMSIAGISTTTKSHPATTVHDGVTLRRYDTTHDVSKAPAAQRAAMEAMVKGMAASARIATFDSLGLIAVAPDSAAEAHRMIDAARGKGSRFIATPATADLIAGSRSRKDSMVIVLDLGALVSAMTGGKVGVQPVVMSIGFADRNAHFRVAAPAASVRAIKSAKP